jgi:GT2 family glycosyltransferase
MDCRPRHLVAKAPVTPPGKSVADELVSYRRWVASADGERRQRAPTVDEVTIGIVVVVREDAPAAGLTRLADTLVEQPHRRWLLLAACAPGSAAGDALTIVRRHLRVVPCDPGASDARAAQCAVERGYAEGVSAFVAVGAQDALAPGALSSLASALRDGADIVYADHDEISDDGHLGAPRLKPDWSPDLLLSQHYTARPVAFSSSAMRSCRGVRLQAGAAWEYDLVLRASEHTDRITHLGEVLLHMGSAAGQGTSIEPYEAEAAVVEETLSRRGVAAKVEDGSVFGVRRIRRVITDDPLVSVVIPFRDGAALLRRCVDSVLRTTSDRRVELVLVDNASVEPETHALLARLAELEGVRVVHDPQPFNWAAINDDAVARCQGDVLLFLNNDTEAIRRGWMTALLEQALRSDVGAVGPRLVYPTGELQHIGVVVGLGGAAGHVLGGVPGASRGYLDMAVTLRETAAVSGACLATRRECFDRVGGFDRSMPTDLNDIDYCLRLGEAGLKTIFTPFAELVHDESPTRGSSGNLASIRSFLERWGELIRAGDPYLSRNLTRRDGSCALRRPGEERWWETWRTTVE